MHHILPWNEYERDKKWLKGWMHHTFLWNVYKGKKHLEGQMGHTFSWNVNIIMLSY